MILFLEHHLISDIIKVRSPKNSPR